MLKKFDEVVGYIDMIRILIKKIEPKLSDDEKLVLYYKIRKLLDKLE